MLLPITTALLEESEPLMNHPFSQGELKRCLAGLKNTANGHDHVHNLMLKNLNEKYALWLLEIVNYSFMNAFVPQEWKKAVIIPLLKPHKTPTDPKSYRPISLLPCVAKLVEKLINTRMYHFLESNRAFSRTQFGFRKKLSSSDHIIRLENLIRKTLLDREICIVVFFDLESAYDCIWHTGLLYKLVKKGIKGKISSNFYKFI